MSAGASSLPAGQLGTYGGLTGPEAPPVIEEDPSAVAALADRLTRARVALAEHRNDEVVESLQTALAGLAGVAAATWSVLGSAFDQLGRPDDRDLSYERAIGLLAQADPLEPALVVDVLPALVSTGNQPGAVELLKDAVARFPDDRTLAELLVVLVDRTGDARGAATALAHAAELAGAGTPAAIGLLTEAVEIAPDVAEHRLTLAQGLLMAGDVGEAEAHLQKALSIAPDDPDVLANAAEAARAVGQLERAQALVDACLARAPEHALALGVAGLIRRDQAQLADDRSLMEQAVDLLARSLAVDPTNLNLAFVQGSCLVLLDRPAEALPFLRTVAAARPGLAAVEGTLAEALAATNDLPGAVDAFDAAIASDPTLAFLHAERAGVLARLGDLEGTLAGLQEAVERDPTDHRFLFQRAETLRLLGRDDEAMADLDRLLGDGTRLAEVVATRGQVLVAMKRFDEALIDLDEALASDPGLAWAWRSKADALATKGDGDGALGAVRQAIELEPGDPSAVVAEGWILVDVEQGDGAVAAARRALALDATHAPAKILLDGGPAADR